MNTKVEESADIRWAKRMGILRSNFPGCQIVPTETKDHMGRVTGELAKIQRQLGRAHKLVAYMEYSSDQTSPFDEFHLLYKRIEPLAMESVEQFAASRLLKLRWNMPELRVIAHYEVEQILDGSQYQEMLAASGRAKACQQVLENLDKDLSKMSPTNMGGRR